MAFVPDEQNQTPGQGAPGTPGATQMASQAPITSSSAPTSGGTGNSINQASSAGAAQPFTNLQTYLTANAPQIQQQAGAISGALTSQYGQATGAIDQAKSDFGTQVNAGYTPANQGAVDNFTKDPTAVAADPNATNAFESQLTDAYKGPASFESSSQYGDAAGKVQAGQSLASQVTSPGGISSYLQSQNPNETQGMATLDSSLVQGDPTANASIQAAAQPFNGLNDYLTSATTAADAGVTRAQQAAQAAQTAAQTAAGKTTTDFSNGLNTAFSTAAQKATDYNARMNNLLTRIQNGGLSSMSPDDQAAIGYNPALTPLMQSYDSVFPAQAKASPIDFSSFYTPGSQQAMPTGANIAKPQDVAEYQALQKLLGQAPAVNFTMPTDPNAAGVHNGPAALPQYNNEAAADAMYSAYNPMVTQLQGANQLPKNAADFWAALQSFRGAPQPTPVNPNPDPTPPQLGGTGTGGGTRHGI